MGYGVKDVGVNMAERALMKDIIKLHHGTCRILCFQSLTHTREPISGYLSLCYTDFLFFF